MNTAPSAVPDFFRNSWISILSFRYTLKMKLSFMLCPLVYSTQLLCLPSVQAEIAFLFAAHLPQQQDLNVLHENSSIPSQDCSAVVAQCFV